MEQLSQSVRITIRYDEKLEQAGLWPYIVTPGTVYVEDGDKIFFRTKDVEASVWFPRSDRLFDEKHDTFPIGENEELAPFIINHKENAGTVFTYTVKCKREMDEQFAEGASSPKMIIE